MCEFVIRLVSLGLAVTRELDETAVYYCRNLYLVVPTTSKGGIIDKPGGTSIAAKLLVVEFKNTDLDIT